MSGDLRPARAYHDLNGVDVIEITGWPGPYAVSPETGQAGVTIIAPRRVDGEFWTFQQPRDGVLKCFSELIGDPSLLTVSTEPMLILLPADRMNIDIRFAEVEDQP